MANQSQLCTYEWAAGQGKVTSYEDGYSSEEEFKQLTKYRPLLTCPECGRRLMGWAQMHDGEVMCWRIPEHKRKGWWKKPRKRVEKRMSPRGK